VKTGIFGTRRGKCTRGNTFPSRWTC